MKLQCKACETPVDAAVQAACVNGRLSRRYAVQARVGELPALPGIRAQ